MAYGAEGEAVNVTASVEKLINFLTVKLAGPAHIVVSAYYRMVLIGGIEKAGFGCLMVGGAWVAVAWVRRDLRIQVESGHDWHHNTLNPVLQPKGWDDADVALAVGSVVIAGVGIACIATGLNQILNPTYSVIQMLINQA